MNIVILNVVHVESTLNIPVDAESISTDLISDLNKIQKL